MLFWGHYCIKSIKHKTTKLTHTTPRSYNTHKTHTHKYTRKTFADNEKEQTQSSDEQCEGEEEDEDDDDEDDDFYYDDDEQNPAGMVISSDKHSVQSTLANNNGSGGTLSIRNAKSVPKKTKPIVNVRLVFSVIHFSFIF